jgi:tetratricopeptide (TPR) repeat protein
MDEVIRLQPGKPEFYNARGIIYEKSGDYVSAMTDYEHALSLNPNSAETAHNIRNLNARFGYPVTLTGQDEAPQNSAAVSVTPQPVSGDPYGRPGMVSFFPEQEPYENNGQTARPVQTEPYGQTADPVSVPAPYGGGGPAAVTAPSADGGYGQTAVIYRSGPAWPALNRMPDRSPAGFVAARTFMDDQAAAAPGRLQESLFPRQQPSRSESNGVTGDGTSARKVFVDPVAEIYNKHGAALYGHGLYDEAIVQFNEAIKAYPNYAIAYNNRGLAFAGKGDLASAAADFDRALRVNPYYYDAQFNRALLLNTVARHQ